jgi:type I restriction enzyme R subunit
LAISYTGRFNQIWRYKDASLDLKWAKPKVRKMIDSYLETLGIDSRIPPVSLLSPQFMGEVKNLGNNPKTKASEMEHAIRRHIKVNLDKDPVLYKRFLKKMEEILERYKDNWQLIVEDLTGLRDQMDVGRKGKFEE